MGHRARFGRDFGTGGAENGTRGEVWRGFSGEIYSEMGGAVGPLPLGRTQPQRALSEAEGRRENGRGRGQAARRTHDTATGGAKNGTPGTMRRGFRDRWGGKWDTGIISAWISRQVGRKMGHLERWEMKYWQNKQSANQCALRYSFISRKTILLYSITFLLKDILRA